MTAETVSHHEPSAAVAPGKVLAISGLHGSFSSASGYQRLIDFLPGAIPITAMRRPPRGIVSRSLGRLARSASFTRWYLPSSAMMEFRAYCRLRATGTKCIHYLWADLDLGFLDLFAGALGCKQFGTFHNCPEDLPVVQFPSRLRRLDGILLVSRSQYPFFANCGVQPSRIHVVLHGVDTQFFVPRVKRHDRFEVVSVGGHRRNFELLREVCRQLESRREIHFCIFAPRHFGPRFAGLSNVTFRSGVSDAELLTAYQQASCLLLTVENATANNGLLEGMACGQPVIAERLGGIPEYMTDECGIMTTPGDADQICSTIRDLQSSPQRCEEMGLAARTRAESLDWRIVAAQTTEIYNA